MIKIEHKGNFKHTERFFKSVKEEQIFSKLDSYGKLGVIALAMNTPVDTGKTASSWSYEIRHDSRNVSICWKNDNMTKTGIPIVILLQYGHGTRNGGYVQGRDFINPAIQPVFDEIAENVWKEITKL